MLTFVACFLLTMLTCVLVVDNARLTPNIERVLPGLCGLLLALQLNALQFGVAGGTALTLLELGIGVLTVLFTPLSSTFNQMLNREEY